MAKDIINDIAESDNAGSAYFYADCEGILVKIPFSALNARLGAAQIIDDTANSEEYVLSAQKTYELLDNKANVNNSVSFDMLTDEAKFEIETMVCSVIPSKFYQYSQTLVKIGEWIDGTPIWRCVIPITDIGEVGIADAWNGWNIRTIDILYNIGLITTTSGVIVIRDELKFQNAFGYDDIDFATFEKYVGGYKADADSLDYARAFFGVVEFSAAVENVNL